MNRVTLTIDGREITVDKGSTVLDAAGRLGIEIPTLCHVEGIEPAAACFLCCVQVEGARTLSPSCALPAADGMVVTTDGDDVRAARKMALELLLSDHAGDCIAPCSAGCPAGLDVSGYVYELASGNVDRSMEVIYDRLSLPGTLGRVCPRLCEESCRRCDWDHEGLAIAALHRYATDRNQKAENPAGPQPGEPSGKKVAIVGAGPAGLTAAFYLRRQGHACTLFDAHPKPGGMLRYGIPEYRLPRAALDDEIRVIERLGATFRMNTRWGVDFSLADLRRDHDAVFIGIGAQLTGALRCEGEDLALSGLDFLREVANGNPPQLGQQVVVIGGGNTAMDASRTALRVGAEDRVLHALEDHVLGEDRGLPVAARHQLEQPRLEGQQAAVGAPLDLRRRVGNAQVRQAVEQDLEVAGLVHYLGGEEDLLRPVRREADHAARPLEGGRLANAVVAQGRDQPLPLRQGERLLGRLRPVPVGPIRQVALHGLEPELEGVDLLEERVGREPVRLDG